MEQSVTVLVGPEASLSPYIHLNDAKTKKSVTLPESGVLISEKLAKLLNVKAGDTFTLPNKDGVDVTLTVGGVVEMYAGHFVVMTPEVYAKFYGVAPQNNAIFVQFIDKDAASVQKGSRGLNGPRRCESRRAKHVHGESNRYHCRFIESCHDDFNGRINFISSRYLI